MSHSAVLARIRKSRAGQWAIRSLDVDLPVRFAGIPVVSGSFGGGHVVHRPAFQAGRIGPGMAAVLPVRVPAKTGLRVGRRGEASDRFKGARRGFLGPRCVARSDRKSKNKKRT